MSAHRPTPKRIAFALLLVPLLAPFYTAIFFAQPWNLVYGLLASYPSAIALGLPGTALLLHWQCLKSWHFALLGLLCAMPALLVYVMRPDITPVGVFNAFNAAVLLGCGVLSGLCFWLVGVAGESPISWKTLLDHGPPG
ncbi:MAG: hypothetical protein ACREVL_03395 [Solimonas sp.]